MKNIIFIFLALSIFSCKVQTEGLYNFVENESQIVIEKRNRELRNATVVGMAKSNGYYYISAASVYKRKIGASATEEGGLWTKETLPPAYQNASKLFESEGKMYANLYSLDGTKSSLFVKDPDWKEVTNSMFIQNVIVLEKDILLDYGNPGEYGTLHKIRVLGKDTDIQGYESPLQVINIVHANSYFAINDKELYKGSDLNSLSKINVLPKREIDESKKNRPEVSIKYTGIEVCGNTIFVTTDLGYIYYSDDDGASFKKSEQLKNLEAEPAFINGIRKINTPSVNEIVILSYQNSYSYLRQTSSSYGFYSSIKGNFSSTSIYGKAIKDFYIDGDVFFILSYGSGLWRGKYDSEKQGIMWVQET